MSNSKAQSTKKRIQAKQNRKSGFREAIQQQGQADIDYYTNLNERDRQTNQTWTQVTTEAAKHIWKK